MKSALRDKAKIKDFQPVMVSLDKDHKLQEFFNWFLGLSYESGRRYLVGLGEGQLLTGCLRLSELSGATPVPSIIILWQSRSSGTR
jgi:hypothetical protein